MYSNKQFILAAMLNNVYKNCKLLKFCIYTIAVESPST